MRTGETVMLPDAPAVPGLAFRHFRGEPDYPGLLAVREGLMDCDGIDPLSTLEGVPRLDELRRLLSKSAAFDPATDLLVVEVDRQIVGYGCVLWWAEQDGVWLYLSLGYLLPTWRGCGRLGELPRFFRELRRAIAAGHPTNGKAMFGANASDTEHAATALLLEEGYTESFRLIELGSDLVDRLREPPLPAGLAIRHALPKHYRTIWESVHEAYATSPQQMVASEEDYQAWLNSPGFDPSLWQVARDGDQVAGQVLCVIERGRGEVVEVSVRHPWRRLGLARALLVRTLNMLFDRGITTVRLHTRGDNERALPLYEHVGFRALKGFSRYRKPMA